MRLSVVGQQSVLYVCAEKHKVTMIEKRSQRWVERLSGDRLIITGRRKMH